MPKDLEPYLLVAAGGFAGACARYVVNVIVPSLPGILIANVTGCVLLGFLLYEAIYAGAFSPRARLLFGAGFLGAYTTFSTFSLQTLRASPELALLNLAANLLLGLAGVLVGRQLAILTARRA